MHTKKVKSTRIMRSLSFRKFLHLYVKMFLGPLTGVRYRTDEEWIKGRGQYTKLKRIEKVRVHKLKIFPKGSREFCYY